MSSERLIYLPLGGAGEIGMNAYVYGYGKPGKERLIVVDLGVAFPDMDTSPGVDLIIPDIAWLEERRDQIEAIFITHAHEDHIGAVAHTYDRLRAPIYTRKFTANIAKRKMDEYGHPHDHLDPPMSKSIYVAPTMEEAENDPIGLEDFSSRILRSDGTNGAIGMPTDRNGNVPKGYEHWANRQNDRDRRDDLGHAGLPPLRGTPEVVIERIKQTQ
ncbi:MBL fold metallo-hydrolase, partial [uncultured Sulfitobacter sp.]|uniref:MBL fold metallo-hydrolase n=1 Tax=uncultured Sulfitobacter sp. TaxID=191468 RepID=UPI0025915AE6